MDKIIFLDNDGVINTNKTLEQGVTIDPVRVELVKRICAETGAKIVSSSSWRANPQAIEYLKSLGLPIVDITVISPRDLVPRGREIQMWLDEHPEVKKYAIIDDDIDMLRTQTHCFFHCRYDENGMTTGLTEEIAERVIAYLNK